MMAGAAPPAAGPAGGRRPGGGVPKAQRRRRGLRRRDIAVLGGCLIGVVLSVQQEGSVSLRKGFSIAWDEELTDDQVRRLPRPHLVDLDGDGDREIVAAASPYKVVAFSNFRSSRAFGDFYQELVTKAYASATSPIIGLGVGYLTRDADNASAATPAPSAAAGAKPRPRPQYVVTVTDDYQVTCYDSKLKQEWSIRLPVPDRWRSAEVEDDDDYGDLRGAYDWFIPQHASVMVLPNQVFQNDSGLVVVAVDVQAPGKEDKEQGEQPAALKGAHFSYYGLHGKDGELRWKHDASDFHEDDNIEEHVRAQHNYKLMAKHLEQHMGEQDWRYYRRNIIAALPHSYTHPHDVRMQVSRFAPRHKRKLREALHTADRGGPEIKDKSKDRRRSADDYGELGDRVRALLQWRRRRPVMPKPNVIVVHTKHGIEAVHLYTGRTLAQVGPMHEGWTYEDVNDDSVIDAIHTQIGDTGGLDTNSRSNWGKQGPKCLGLVWSGVPVSQTLQYNKSICIDGGLLHQFEFLKTLLRGDEDNEGTESNALGGFQLPGWGGRDHFDEHLTAAPPLAVHRHVHEVEHHGAIKYRTDVLFYISSGFVTCLDGHTGNVRWHADTDSAFGAHAAGVHLGHQADGEKGADETALDPRFRAQVHELPAHAHMRAYSLMTKTEPHPQDDVVTIRNIYYVYPTQFVLAVGTKVLSVLNAASGHLEEEFRLEQPALAPVMVDDFNGDGVNDIIVVSKGGIWGVVARRRAAANVITATLVCVMGLLGLLFVSHYTAQAGADRYSRRSALHRSTD
eukprot:TRINITY_DN70693_c0_g1_i1.p1 TRINITY_DN70693_c0_g1~~TRINITY_DN70693_c0_g1_i1.p1  ORF type:complete len:826 (+),score=289.96 TRINITY_DN70693_c0_g1_i1:113-2479(+)